ncbi:MAG: glycoside hydrolase family 18 protein [Clostridia bacterium]|nr:glycoside hydrolase family 18 protein [Clostridia bacterium]
MTDKKSIRGLALLLAFLAMLAQPFYPQSVPAGQAREEAQVTVYFPNWNIYSSSSQQVKNLPWNRLDCVNHAFWKVVPQSGGYAIVSTDSWADTDPNNDKAHFPQYAAYAKKYPGVEILLSIGGWTRSGYFSKMSATEHGRATFIQSCVDTLTAYPFFTGLDIDWEYPGVARKGSGDDEGNPVAGDDWTNYVLLLKELRAALDKQFGIGKKRLTVCAGGAEAILAKQNYAALHPYVDRINLMTYDMTGISAKVTGHHSPLYGDPSADTAVKYLLRQGVPARKIAIGSPLYSHGWKNVNLAGSLLGASGTGITSATRLWKAVRAYEASAVPIGTPGWHAGYDENAQAAYLWNDDPNASDYRVFLTYENSRSLAAKLEYIRTQGLGGIIVWQSGGDDASSGFPMLTQMHKALHP